MTSSLLHPFLLGAGQSQCLALCAAPPPKASAEGGVITLSPSSPLIPSHPAPNLLTLLCPSTTTSALLNLGGTSLQYVPCHHLFPMLISFSSSERYFHILKTSRP
ncbi:hypothetical protein BS47DRAFT_381061 [Hydnum rufescens UP504]|uniref:Uncharacterized protein n=1 Tax=Hydnum rufescens UP504 TaxID=1448309 RepID=A0A9P6AL04_9AGAM|nr:hypothetical protein BS47DRAFT_381061 [Hydnum rufescens UP504]